MHKLLARQLRKLGLSPDIAPDAENWQWLLEKINDGYHQFDRERQLLERSLDLTSEEMQALYQRLEAEASTAIAAEHEKLNVVLTSMTAGIVAFDQKGLIHFINPTAMELLGLDSAPAQIHTLWQTLRQLADNPDKLPPLDREALLAMGREFRSHNQCELKAADRRLTLDWKMWPAPEITGFTGYVLLLTDISERVRLEEHLSQVQKMEAMGTLVGGVAHDFNNILAGMLGSMTLIRKQYQWLPDLVDQISQIETLGYRGADMIKQMMSFSRKDSLDKVPVSLRALFKETAKLARLSVPENIHFSHDCDDHELMILGNITQLQQVIINLINNARDALSGSENPTLRLGLSSFKADVDFRFRYPQHNAEHYAVLTVEDNGCGIDSKILSRIFDPFFTTKDVGKGTGLGLAMIYGVVQQLGGIIEVESQPREGSQFKLYFPLIQAEEETNTAPHGETMMMGHGELVLLVDDEKVVRESFKGMLHSLGYQVTTAENGLDGLDVFCQNRNDFDLIITDAVMPGMNGDILACSIRELNPTIPIIFSTGYDKNQVLDDSLRLDHTQVLTKPFSLEQLSEVIHELLTETQNQPVEDMPAQAGNSRSGR